MTESPWLEEGFDEAAYRAELEDGLMASMESILLSDDRLAATHAELKRQAAEIAVLKVTRNGFMNGKGEVTRLLKAEQRKTAWLQKKLNAADAELESLRERIALMEEAR